MKQIIKYITKSKENGKVKRIGVMVAEKDGDSLQFGYSLYNNNDRKAVRDKNIELRKIIAALKKKHKSGKNDVEGAPKLLPEFDKKEALRVAKTRMTKTVILDSVPDKIRNEFHTFVRRAISWAHADKYIK